MTLRRFLFYYTPIHSPPPFFPFCQSITMDQRAYALLKSLKRDPAYIPWFVDDDNTQQPFHGQMQLYRPQQRAPSKRFRVAPNDAVSRLQRLIESNQSLIERIQEQDASWSDVKAIELYKNTCRIYFKTWAARNQFNSLRRPLIYASGEEAVRFHLHQWYQEFAYFRISCCTRTDGWITEMSERKKKWSADNNITIHTAFMSRSQMYWKIPQAKDAKKLLRDTEVVLDGRIGTAE